LDISKVLTLLNQARQEKVISDYAIGGGIAALFYIEPILTYDLDVFVLIPTRTDIILLTPIYNFLTNKGFQWKGEHVIVDNVPVQFILADELEAEAIKNARIRSYRGIKTKVISPEYLVCLSLRAGRSKDLAKVRMIFEQSKVNATKLNNVLTKYNLLDEFSRLKMGGII